MRGSKQQEEAVYNLCAQRHVYHGPSPQGSPFCLLGGIRTQDEVLKTQNLPNLLGCNFLFVNSVALQNDSYWSASCNLSHRRHVYSHQSLLHLATTFGLKIVIW
ncbi:hypothetical protein Peur_039933 [Populus x canadensis]